MTEPITVTDRRHRPSRLVLGESVEQARQAVRARLPREGASLPGVGDTNPFAAWRKGKQADPVEEEMRRNRRVNRRTGSGVGGVGAGGSGAGYSGVSFATGRPRDPMFYWRQNNLPWDVTKDDELRKIREFCRLLYQTHPIIAGCIDIFSKFPLQGMSLECKDEQLRTFYSDLFFDQLDYEDYLLDIGREFWTCGESWPLGSFNEMLGVWEDDELLNPDDVQVERSPFLREPRFLIRLPQTLRKVLQERAPRWEYDALMRSYPELAAYAGEDSLMPVSNILLKQLKFQGDTFHKRGIPILMRAFRAVIQEEMLNAAMDAIADRLYTPLILVKLGASASDLGTEAPWIPTQGDLEDFEEAFDAAMAGDFRVMIHHFAVDMEPVFGRENMPDMSADFERLEERILQVFGLSKTMLNGADQGETYAADALNRDVVVQLMSHHQRQLRKFYEDRAIVVAEAQEHFDYDVRNGKRYVIMEEILETDEESGEQRIVEQPKLLIPDLTFDTLNLQDEQTERQFMEALNATGVPVPYSKRILGTGLDFDDMVQTRKTEEVALTLAEQEARREKFTALRDANLPVPDDLVADFQPKAVQAQQRQQQAGNDALTPALGQDPLALPALAPTPDDLAQGEDSAADPAAAPPMGMVIPMPGQPQRPPESDEQRAAMPKPAHKVANYRVPSQIRRVTAEHYTPPDNSIEDPDRPEHFRPTGRFGHPSHIGMRRHITVPESEKWDPERSKETG